LKKAKILLLTLVFLVLSIQPGLASTVFYDTYGHWAETDIDYAVNTLKVFKGYGDFTFKPENDITRAEFIAILVRTASKQNKMNEVYTSNMAYNDMSSSHWSYTYVISMYEHLKSKEDYTFVDIFPGGNFNPNEPITRMEAAALIAVFSNSPIYDNPLPFSDVEESNKYYDELEILYNSEIIKGYSDNTFQGGSYITRAESAALIKRIYDDFKTSDPSKYLTQLDFMPIKGENIYSFFGNYDFNTTDTNDNKYIKAKNTLEYIAFGGYIFPEDSHLYDLNALETLSTLRTNAYFNVAGTNFYMMTFGDYTTDEKTQFANEILADIISRNDLEDSELMQLFTMISKYDVTESLYMSALEKWYSTTSDDSSKANILFFRYAYYVKTDDKDTLKTLVYEDLKKSVNMTSLLTLNWNFDNSSSIIDFRNYTFGLYNYSLYKNTDLYRYMLNTSIPYNSKVVELSNLLLIEKSENQDFSSLSNYENIYYKYSLNRLYVLNFIGEEERAFVEGINDYTIIKTFNVYNTQKTVIDSTYTGILKKIKY
jgi:hypothetical protein